MIAAATGMDMDEDRLWDTAARDRNLIRSINVRLGLRRADEEECEDHYKRRDPEMEAKLKDAYYELWGWNNEGIPDEALDRLDLDYIKEDFKQRRIL
jgi:aldehyde:ferredoxin oxidoreductase